MGPVRNGVCVCVHVGGWYMNTVSQPQTEAPTITHKRANASEHSQRQAENQTTVKD